MNDQHIREEQAMYARQVERDNVTPLRRPGTLTVRRAAKPANAPKGHEAFLKALEASGAQVQFEKASSGEKIVGKIKTSDKYTISVAVPVMRGSEQFVTRVLFKHDLSEFSTISRVVDASVDVSADTSDEGRQ